MFKDMIMHDQSNSVNKVGVLLLHLEAGLQLSFMCNINTVLSLKVSVSGEKKVAGTT